jgi:hypothetical protein
MSWAIVNRDGELSSPEYETEAEARADLETIAPRYRVGAGLQVVEVVGE